MLDHGDAAFDAVGELILNELFQQFRNGVSMTTNFKNAEGRHLIIYADGRRVGRYVAMALHLDGDGRIEKWELSVSAL